MLEPRILQDDAAIIGAMLCGIEWCQACDGTYWTRDYPKQQIEVDNFKIGVGCHPNMLRDAVRTIVWAVDSMIHAASQQGANCWVMRSPPQFYLRRNEHEDFEWALVCAFRGLFLKDPVDQGLRAPAQKVSVGWFDGEGVTVSGILEATAKAIEAFP